MPMPGWPGMSIVGNGLEVSATSSSISLSSSVAVAELAAEHLAGLVARAVAGQRVEHAVLGGLVGAGLDPLAHVLADHHDGGVDEVAHDLLDVAADIADLGELGRLDLEERRLGELGEAARDLGLADAGRADHQDVLRVDLVADVVGQLLAPPAVAQRHGDGALGVGLADDEAVELGDDLAGGEVGHVAFASGWCCMIRASPVRPRAARDRPEAGLGVGADGAGVVGVRVDDDGAVALGAQAGERRPRAPPSRCPATAARGRRCERSTPRRPAAARRPGCSVALAFGWSPTNQPGCSRRRAASSMTKGRVVSRPSTMSRMGRAPPPDRPTTRGRAGARSQRRSSG